jgi:hypothetical protein
MDPRAKSSIHLIAALILAAGTAVSLPAGCDSARISLTYAENGLSSCF